MQLIQVFVIGVALSVTAGCLRAGAEPEAESMGLPAAAGGLPAPPPASQGTPVAPPPDLGTALGVANGSKGPSAPTLPASPGAVARVDPATENLPVVPLAIPPPQADGIIYLTGTDGKPRATTIMPDLQDHLKSFIEEARSPIAAIVVADVHTGNILAMAQGRAPSEWGGRTHTALHAGFPAASVFKTVVTTAAFEVANLNDERKFGLNGGCAHVRQTGEWLKDREITRDSAMSLRRAFGHSCNGFFAKIGVNQLGLGIITNFARRYGWETGVPADFHMDHSPFLPPSATNSSTYSVGRFAAGFGRVGMSAAHAAYIMLAIANKGEPVPLRLFRTTPLPAAAPARERIYSSATATHMLEILDASVKGGTASFAYRHGKYRKLRDLVGGKTGTLTGSSPAGLTSWFAGIAPLYAPEVVVASVVILEDHWHIKGPSLAAEGFWSYFNLKANAPETVPTASLLPLGKRGDKTAR